MKRLGGGGGQRWRSGGGQWWGMEGGAVLSRVPRVNYATAERVTCLFLFVCCCCCCWRSDSVMVVLESPGPLSTGVGLVDPPSSPESPPSSAIPVITHSRTTMKLLPKRFINIHSWLSPICPKQLKEAMVQQLIITTYKLVSKDVSKTIYDFIYKASNRKTKLSLYLSYLSTINEYVYIRKYPSSKIKLSNIFSEMLILKEKKVIVKEINNEYSKNNHICPVNKDQNAEI